MFIVSAVGAIINAIASAVEGGGPDAAQALIVESFGMSKAPPPGSRSNLSKIAKSIIAATGTEYQLYFGTHTYEFDGIALDRYKFRLANFYRDSWKRYMYGRKRSCR